MKNFSDVPKSDFDGYPKPIYNDGDTKLEIWKFNGPIAEYSRLTLLIANKLFSEGEIGAVKINGDECVCLKPPRKMSPQIRDALQDERFEAEGEDDIEPTTEFFIIRLGEALAYDIGRLFDENNVVYDKEQYAQFIKDRGAEEDELRQIAVPPRSEAQEHNFVRIRRSILEIASQIENPNLEDYDNAEEILQDLKQRLREVEEEIYALSNLSKALDEEGAYDLAQETEKVAKRIKSKLDEIGCESSEDL